MKPQANGRAGWLKYFCIYAAVAFVAGAAAQYLLAGGVSVPVVLLASIMAGAILATYQPKCC